MTSAALLMNLGRTRASKLGKRLRRLIRYNAVTERAQQIARHHSLLSLGEIGVQLDIRPDDAIIDCGANVGDMTSRFARTGATVFAFEPNRLCFSVLKRRFALIPNVQCFNEGVMDRECILSLCAPKGDAEWDHIDATVASSFKASDAHGESYDVRCIRLSDFILSLDKPVSLLKMDIEGSEIEVLNDLFDSKAIYRVGLTVVETHERQQPLLLSKTNALRSRIDELGLSSKVRLDWI